MSEEKIEVSVVLPAHNEARRLAEAVEQTRASLVALSYSFELLIAEDGSADGTDKLAQKIEAGDPCVRHIHSVERLGKGKALSNAFKQAGGEIIAFIDVDLSTDMRHMKELIESVRTGGFDLAVGSRLLKGSEVTRSFKRKIMSIIYNSSVRVILKSKIKDHQCGFKAFRRDSLMDLLEAVEAEGWFWDTELLVYAQQRGYQIKEIQIKWSEKGDTKVETFKDSFRMFSDILKLYFRLRQEQNKKLKRELR